MGPTIFPINKRVYTLNDRILQSGKKVAGWPFLPPAGTLFVPVLGNIAEGTSVHSFLCLPEDPTA